MEETNCKKPMVEVVVEIPRGGFLKRGAGEEVDFVSPFPCPFNYGAVYDFRGGDNDYLDAVVLGKRLSRGDRVRVEVFGAIGFTDRGIYDDKLICGTRSFGMPHRWMILLFFHFYAFCKQLLNTYRDRPGSTRCDGWVDARAAIRRAVPSGESFPIKPPVPF